METWKLIHDFASQRVTYKPDGKNIYIISDYGRVAWVRPSTILDEYYPLPKAKVRSPSSSAQGHEYIKLTSNKNRPSLAIHRLVMEHFGTSWPGKGYEINHIDGNTKHNKAKNLEWVTHSYNVKQGFEILNRYRATKTSSAHGKFRSLAQIELIFKLYCAGGYTQQQLSTLSGVSTAAINKIIKTKGKIKQTETYTKNTPKQLNHKFPAEPYSIFVGEHETVLFPFKSK